MNIPNHHPSFAKVELPEVIHVIYENFLDTHKYQEAIWLLHIYGHANVAAAIEQWLQQYMLTATAISYKVLARGATKTYLVTLTNGISGVFKPEQFNPSANLHSEAGAYRLDQLLNLNIVPCTIIRKVPFFNKQGSFQYYLADAELASSLDKAMQVKPVTMLLLDFLMENRDRYAGNYMYLESLNKMVAIDNGWGLRGNGLVETIKGFFIDRRPWKHRWGRMSFPPDLEFDQALYLKLQDLDNSMLQDTFIPLIGTVATDKFIDRQKKVLEALTQAYL